MASIVSSGIGSGLDISGIVQQLVAAEAAPVETRLVQQESRAQGKLSAFGGLKAVLSELRDKLDNMRSADKFLSRSTRSSNEDAFTATAEADALPASYSLDIVQLAQAQKLTSGAFTGADAAVGSGTLTVALGAQAIAVEIGAENNTLADIRDAINSAPDNPGVAATIVNADNGSYLILAGDKTGVANNITVTQSGGDGGLSALEYDPANSVFSMTESIAAQDALIRIDGLDVMSSGNSFVGAVQGVTIDISATTEGSSEQLVIKNDLESTRELVAGFVDSYNNLVSTIDSVTNYNSDSETAAPLIGDATVRGVRDQIRRELSVATDDPNSPFSFLGDIGIEVQLDGKLAIDDTKLTNAMNEDFNRFGQLFSANDGYATRLFTLTDGFLQSDGIIESRTQGLTSTIEGFGDDREALNERLASLETRLLRQFNALDSLLAQLSSTSTFLSQQLSNLPGVNRPGTN